MAGRAEGNLLLELLEAEGGGVPALKAIYRRLCKATHPDSSGAGSSAFIQLRADYEEALAIVTSPIAREVEGGSRGTGAAGRDARAGAGAARGGSARAAGAAGRASIGPAEARRRALVLLHRLALKCYTKEAFGVVDRLVPLVAAYDAEAAVLLARYRADFLETFSVWRGDGEVFYAHSLLVALIMQLFYYFDGMRDRHRRLLEEYAKSLSLRASKLDPGRRALLEGLGAWIIRESRGEPVVP